MAEEYGTLTQDQIGLASSAQAVNPVRGDVGNPDPYMMGQGNMLMTGTLVLWISSALVILISVGMQNQMMPQNYYMSSGMNNQMMMPQYDPMSGIAQCVKVHFFVQKFKKMKIIAKKVNFPFFLKVLCSSKFGDGVHC